MSNKQLTRERRRNVRFRVYKGAMAFVDSSSNLIGQIGDISKGGFSFKYLQLTREENNAKNINLFVSKHNYLIEKLPVQVISDIQVISGPSFSQIRMRRCGVQFGSLTIKQSSDLDLFIRNFSGPP